MSLSPAEKIAGRKFRDDQSVALMSTFDTDPPTYQVPNFLAYFRHECSKRGNRSTALELKERYVFSSAYYVVDGAAYDVLPPDHPMDDATEVPAGRFGFIYKEGKCTCGDTARSKAGRLVDAYDRPPVQGRVARQ